MTRGLLGRLLAAMCGVAAVSTGLPLLLQERSLAGRLERAAETRLERAASAAARLLEGHLDATAQRYRAVAGTPQFRATLEVNDAPTLTHYAETLLEQQHASRILFVGLDGRMVAAAGDPRLDGALAARDAGVMEDRGRALAVIDTPLASAGYLIAVEPIEAQTLELWSELCGAEVAFVPSGLAAGEASERGEERIQRRVRSFDGLELVVSSPLQAERQAMAAARLNLAITGAVGLTLALCVSLVVSRSLVLPIRELRTAAGHIGSGDLTTRVATHRTDEIGGVARAFEEMSDRLRATIRRVAESADRVDATSSDIARGTERFLEVTRAQQQGSREAGETLAEIEERMQTIADSAGRSLLGIDTAVDGSAASFRDLEESGRALQASAERLWTQTEEIGGSIERVAGSATRMARQSDELLPAVEATAQAVGEVAAAARSVNEHAGETSRLSETVVASADDGRRVVRDAVAGMDATLETIGQSERVIDGLRRRAEEIGSILSVIDEVTDETGLLALNASIIAAQAGDHGRGFDVVAGEMKALADRVQASTQEIEALVRAVQQESSDAVAAIAAGSARAREGALLIGRAESALGEITRAAREAGDRMNESASATAEQMVAAGAVAEEMETVREGMARIRDAARDQAEANDLLERGTRALRAVARDVRASVDTQTHDAERIGSSIEEVQRAVREITSGLEVQGTATRQVAEVIRRSLEHTRSHEASAVEMGEAARNLEQQADEMRDAVGRFRIEESAASQS